MASSYGQEHDHPHTNDHSDGRSLNAVHEHFFLGDDHDRNERRTWLVIAITATMMVVEIVAGNMFGSMALTADGWHMSTHAAALLIAALAYLYARKHAHNRRFSFGSGKLGDARGLCKRRYFRGDSPADRLGELSALLDTRGNQFQRSHRGGSCRPNCESCLCMASERRPPPRA